MNADEAPFFFAPIRKHQWSNRFYNAFMESSADTPACFNTPESVPILERLT